MLKFWTTLRFPEHPEWAEQGDVFDRSGRSESHIVRAILAAARRYETIVLDGTGRPEQIAAAIIGVWPRRRRPRIVVTDATWKRGSSALDRFAGRFGMRLMDGEHVTYCVLSRWEAERFPHTWNVDPERVRFTVFCTTTTLAEQELPVSDDGRVFTGGDSLRDYETLLAAAPAIAAPITIASRTLDPALAPADVTIETVTPEQFEEMNRSASVILVILADSDDRTAGQQSFLNAMVLGKPVVVTDAPGVAEYVEDGRTGWLVPLANPEALSRTVNWILDPGNEEEVRRVCEQARETVRARFSRSNYLAALFAVIAEARARS